MDFGDMYATVRNLNTFRYLISLVRKKGSNIEHLAVVTVFLNPEVDDDDIYMTMSKSGPKGLNSPVIFV